MIDINFQQTSGGPTRIGDWCQLRIVLEGPAPEIWRRLVVPANATMGWLHAVLQISMGWTNSHLHEFRSGDKVISSPKFELEQFGDSSPVVDEGKIRLNEVVSASGETFTYQYDFGDSWDHLIMVEDLLDPGVAIKRKAVCLGGEGACPPEDCGGYPGYANLLEALRDRKHPEHKAMQEWLGRPFDADHFLVADANFWLGKLSWPRVTEAGLGKILTARFRM